MSFNSEIGFTSCPNYKDGILNRDYNEYDNANWMEGNVDAMGSKDFNQVCFNVCPTKDEEKEGAPDQAYYVENLHCKKCPDPNDKTGQGEDNYRDPPLSGTVQDLKNKGIYGMCKDNPIYPPIAEYGRGPVQDWWTRQQDANISQIYVNKVDWRTQDSQLWKNADRGMTDIELLHALGKRRPGTLEYVLPPEYMNGNTPNYNKLRTDINDGRGSIVECVDVGEGAVDWLDSSDVCAREDATVDEDGTLSCPAPCELINENSIHSKCKSQGDLGKCYNTSEGTYVGGTKFGPNHIIPEEAYDFWENLYGTFELPDTSSDGVGSVATFAELLKGIGADSTFEACVNDVLNTGHNDLEIQENISKYESIKEFKSEDINYLKRKLRKIITIKTNQLNECMNLLNLGESICTTGIADKTLQIGRLIFSIVGNDKVDVINMDNDEKMILNRLVDELGPLIPQAIKSIIRVSKEYESRICNTPSNTTLLLERLYIDLYDKETKVNLDISPYIDFSSLINIKNDWQFIKTMCVIIVFSFLFMQFSNVVVAFLSRGPSVTKIA